MRQMAIILCLLMAILTSCQSEHERQVQMLNDLLEATDNYEVMPNDSDARAVLFYMERHGSPRELQQAWRIMAKMYRRHGAPTWTDILRICVSKNSGGSIAAASRIVPGTTRFVYTNFT